MTTKYMLNGRRSSWVKKVWMKSASSMSVWDALVLHQRFFILYFLVQYKQLQCGEEEKQQQMKHILKTSAKQPQLFYC